MLRARTSVTTRQAVAAAALTAGGLLLCSVMANAHPPTERWESGTAASQARAESHLSVDAGDVAGTYHEQLPALLVAPRLTPALMLAALLLAAGLGGLHALSPGHGKAIVGAYLVGARGTARHAAFLGLTVTVTHTLGVFALGVVSLFAARYVLPERLVPILSLTSGGIILVIGLSLFVTRLRSTLARSSHYHHEHGGHLHRHDVDEHHHDQPHHDHAPDAHSQHDEHHHHPHALDQDGGLDWRSLLAIGISGGMVPCPSALVVLLTAISLQRIGFGMLLIVAFSIGLAATLSGVGLVFLNAERLVRRPLQAGWRAQAVPVLSAVVITGIGGAMCYRSLVETGVNVVQALLASSAAAATGPVVLSTVPVLGLGLVFGLRHALDADHVAAVSTIVSDCKSLLSSSLVGGLWGVGHTISLLVAGIAVIVLHLEIGPQLARGLEFCVGLMLVLLGANVVRQLLHDGMTPLHAHRHGGALHFHPSGNDIAPVLRPRPHYRLGLRPLLIGMVHGLAGSAALMLLVLSTIPSPALGLAYITVFGIGSIGGMLCMSMLVGLPVHLTANRFARLHLALRTAAGLFSLGFGLLMLYQIGGLGGLP